MAVRNLSTEGEGTGQAVLGPVGPAEGKVSYPLFNFDGSSGGQGHLFY